MPATAKSLRICPKGHKYYKSTDCPTCPICEAAKVKAAGGFLAKLSAPAYRALKRAKLLTLKKISRHSEQELLKLHGMGPSSIPVLRKALKYEGLAFAEKKKAAVKHPVKTVKKSAEKSSGKSTAKKPARSKKA